MPEPACSERVSRPDQEEGLPEILVEGQAHSPAPPQPWLARLRFFHQRLAKYPEAAMTTRMAARDWMSEFIGVVGLKSERGARLVNDQAEQPGEAGLITDLK